MSVAAYIVKDLLESITLDARDFVTHGWMLVRNLVITSNFAFGLAVLYLMFFAVRVKLGMAQLREAVPKIGVVIVTLAVATGYGFFNGIVYDLFAVQPLRFGETIAGISSNGGSLGARLDLVLTQGFEAGYSIMSAGGFTDIAPFVFGFIVWLATLIVVGWVALYIAISQFTVACLLVLFPFFIPLSFFQMTRGFLANYLNALFTAALLPVLTLVVTAFFLHFVEARVVLLAASPDAAAVEIGGFLLAVLVMCGVLFFTPQVAAQLGGGASLSSMGVVNAAAGFVAKRFNPAPKRFVSRDPQFDGKQRTATRDFAYLRSLFRRGSK